MSIDARSNGSQVKNPNEFVAVRMAVLEHLISEKNAGNPYVKNITPALAALVFGRIDSYTNMKHGVCWASQRRIARDLGLDPRIIRRCVRALESLGLIQLDRSDVPYRITTSGIVGRKSPKVGRRCPRGGAQMPLIKGINRESIEEGTRTQKRPHPTKKNRRKTIPEGVSFQVESTKGGTALADRKALAKMQGSALTAWEVFYGVEASPKNVDNFAKAGRVDIPSWVEFLASDHGLSQWYVISLLASYNEVMAKRIIYWICPLCGELRPMVPLALAGPQVDTTKCNLQYAPDESPCEGDIKQAAGFVEWSNQLQDYVPVDRDVAIAIPKLKTEVAL